MQNTAGNPGPQGKRKEIMESRDNELKGVLTGDQFQKYQVHEQEMREKMRERRANMPQAEN